MQGWIEGAEAPCFAGVNGNCSYITDRQFIVVVDLKITINYWKMFLT